MKLIVAPCVLFSAAVASDARAQAFNIDFGPAGSAPSASYAAAGVAGAWNPVPLLEPWLRTPLVSVSGAASTAQLYMFGCDSSFAADDPLTLGDDGALMDDMLISFNSPVDACIWVEGLPNGTYEVLTYAMTPGLPTELHRVRVDNATTGPVMIGGAWPGTHVECVTYARHTVTITGGVIGLHSGLWGANITSGINGIQVRRTDGCYPDCNGTGTLTVADFGCFQGKYVLGDLYADCNASGTLTVADFGCFQGHFVIGCP
ncbi:MAG: hypothetical protein ACKVU4_02255 [Phycisphaerales bacterium]